MTTESDRAQLVENADALNKAMAEAIVVMEQAGERIKALLARAKLAEAFADSYRASLLVVVAECEGRDGEFATRLREVALEALRA